MNPGARTPEELESLYEDAFLLRDRQALVELFEDGGVLAVADGEPPEARMEEAIARLATEVWAADRAYLAEPRRVVQARDTALVLGARGVNVVRRGSDGAWRYAISVLTFDDVTSGEEQ